MGILNKYLLLLLDHGIHVLPLAAKAASLSSRHFSLVASVLQKDPLGAVLPELAVGLVLLHLKLPLLMQSITSLPQLLTVFVDHLDKVNRCALGAQKDDEEDLSWPGVKSKLHDGRREKGKGPLCTMLSYYLRVRMYLWVLY